MQTNYDATNGYCYVKIGSKILTTIYTKTALSKVWRETHEE
ncbi:hypothetical protein WMO40_18530 [Bacillaceae bacterium CLA-AA-H227]|uniref:Uncharacterized protein n=1 Tax=Robertmurraya yapensis (ex Hitch et al 2024) TaxID=3133160 RepID=A0ACC6SFE6_9BACI